VRIEDLILSHLADFLAQKNFGFKRDSAKDALHSAEKISKLNDGNSFDICTLVRYVCEKSKIPYHIVWVRLKDETLDLRIDHAFVVYERKNNQFGIFETFMIPKFKKNLHYKLKETISKNKTKIANLYANFSIRNRFINAMYLNRTSIITSDFVILTKEDITFWDKCIKEKRTQNYMLSRLKKKYPYPTKELYKQVV